MQGVGMERIKQAIESAKNTESNGAEELDKHHSESHGTRKRHSTPPPNKVRERLKITLAFVLILFSGWLWLRLDFMNQLELIASEYINDGVKQARAEARRRLVDDAKFKQLTLGNLAHCQEAAEKNRENYLKLMRDAVRSKNASGAKGTSEKFVISTSAAAKAEKMLKSAKAKCQRNYETHLQAGK